MADKRKWMWRAAGFLVALLAGAGTWAALNATDLQAKFTAHKLATATTDDERAACADTLVGYGEPGVRRLVLCIQSSDDPVRDASVAAIEKYLTGLTDGDARAVALSATVLDAFSAADDAGKRAVMRLVPTVLNRTGGAHAARCRVVVAEGLKMTDAGARLAVVRLAIHPDVKLHAEVVPLLAAPEPEVRALALFAVASSPDALVSDEELFRWLHDADAGVRKVCRDALVARSRSDVEIALGRRLTHADPGERLKLLLDLRYDDDVTDPEPWLERLGRDPEPAVRAGAARVAMELATAHKLACPAWVGRVADGDAHPTVRFVVAYYRGQSAVAPGGHVMPAGR